MLRHTKFGKALKTLRVHRVSRETDGMGRVKNRTSFILFERTATPDTSNDENINRVSNNRLGNLYKGIPIVTAMFQARKSDRVLSILYCLFFLYMDAA